MFFPMQIRSDHPLNCMYLSGAQMRYLLCKQIKTLFDSSDSQSELRLFYLGIIIDFAYYLFSDITVSLAIQR